MLLKWANRSRNLSGIFSSYYNLLYLNSWDNNKELRIFFGKSNLKKKGKGKIDFVVPNKNRKSNKFNDIYIALNSAQIPACKEPSGLARSDGKRPDSCTLVSRKTTHMGRNSGSLICSFHLLYRLRRCWACSFKKRIQIHWLCSEIHFLFTCNWNIRSHLCEGSPIFI